MKSSTTFSRRVQLALAIVSGALLAGCATTHRSATRTVESSSGSPLRRVSDRTVAPRAIPVAKLEPADVELPVFRSWWRQQRFEAASTRPVFPNWDKSPSVKREHKLVRVFLASQRIPFQLFITTSDDSRDVTGRHTETIFATPSAGAIGTMNSTFRGAKRHVYINSCGVAGFRGYCFAVPGAWLKRYVYIDAFWNPPAVGQPPSNAIWVMRVT